MDTSQIFDIYSESEEEAEGPSILSSDPEKRKLARKLRIQKRVEERTKFAKIEEDTGIEITAIEQQILDSFEKLERLQEEGVEVVTGVRVANDARELERRKEVQDTRRRLLEVLEEEDKKYMEKYDEINAKWPEIFACKDPLDIHDELEAQKSKCLAVLEKKNALILELKEELEKADDKFAEEVKQQNKDIDLLIERMENQVRSMTKAYRHELTLIENVIESERKMLLATSMEKWKALFKKYQEDTVEAREKKKEIMREYEEDMKKAIIEHQEEFRRLKINFELEIQGLQQEVQNMKALCLMNVEKLDYNYAVLKRREEENTIVKNQQKRKINKLQDVINGLRKTYADLEDSTKSEIQKLTTDISKSQKAIRDLEEKSNNLAAINDKKYMQIWDLNIQTADELVDKILTADKIIHEQLLGLEWEPPKMQLLRKEDLTSYCGAMCAIKKEKEEAKKRRMISKTYEPERTLEQFNLERSLLNHIAKLITDHCEYYIEDTLKELLSHYTEEDKLLIRLDKVFEALKITSEEELQFLLNFFLPYAYCPVCTAKPVILPSVCGESVRASSSGSSSSKSSLSKTSSSKTSAVKTSSSKTFLSKTSSSKTSSSKTCSSNASSSRSSSTETTLPPICGETHPAEAALVAAMHGTPCCTKPPVHKEEKEETQSETVETSTTKTDTPLAEQTDTPFPEQTDTSTCVAEGIVEVTDESTGKPKRRLVCDKGHLLEIETEFVANALKEFLERYEYVKRQDIIVPIEKKEIKVKVTVSRNITDDDITEFWQRYKNIFSPEKERLWDNLLIGLKKYHLVLKERHELNKDIKCLQKQNTELTRLLTSYSEQSDPVQLLERNTKEIQYILQDS
ncbi:dynein regulatory complex protein 1 [Halictus rubicundus]|uniref:dynein regulatory complex protein 1 n=1 Tax=Halictus rubicundus TaxID=77578 RepID=UPI0040361BE6